MNNPYLINILKKAGIKIPGEKSFKRIILPETIKKVKNVINTKLEDASVVILIVDIWSDSQMNDFMGLAAMITNNILEKECLVIGFAKMIGAHNSENIKKSMELIINSYTFDKSKIKGNIF